MTFAGFNRRMRKTARPVVWKGYGVQFPVPPSDQQGGLVVAAPVGRGAVDSLPGSIGNGYTKL